MSLPTNLQKDELQDSWVDVHYQNSGGHNSPKKDSEGYTPLNVEKLLKDAQKEFTNNSSRDTSARGSPKGIQSPTNELASTNGSSQDERVDPGTDWIWDWSSSPDINPGVDIGAKFRHLSQRRNHMSVRRQQNVSVFSLENLPILSATHAFAFLIGAVVNQLHNNSGRKSTSRRNRLRSACT